MCRKLAYLSSVVLALGVVLTSVSRAELLAHWTFDEGSGTMIQDSSGNGHDGVISGTPQWVSGVFGGALDFHNTVGAEIPNFDPTGGTGSFSLAFWCNWDGTGNIQHYLTKSNGWNSATMVFQVENKGLQLGDPARDRRLHLAYQSQPQAVLHVIPDNEWSHNTLVFDGAAGTATGYLNGVDIEGPKPTGIGQDVDSTILIGVAQPLNRIFQGSLDDMWLFSHVLSPAEIQQVMMGGLAPGQASNPNPADGATDVPRDVALSWTPGEYAPAVDGHTVYLSVNFNDVNDGIGGTPQSASSYDPGRLDFETTYYWRIDEVNGPPDFTVHPGEVWSFTTEPVGYPIDGVKITATASSTGGADFGPEKTIDGSGLDDNDLHSTEPTTMWVSANEPLGAWIQYEFDRMQKLHQMWVWNSNQMLEGLFGFGMKDVTVEYSTNGADWATVAEVPQFAKAPGTAGYAHDTTVDFGGAVAQFVRLTATSNWGGVLPQYGLSEVRFLAIPVSAREPSPDSGASDVGPD
ncbi:MAG: LamG-like jellyroll fold domain-containing protein, partial [Planctomycetota bacterium]